MRETPNVFGSQYSLMKRRRFVLTVAAASLGAGCAGPGGGGDGGGGGGYGGYGNVDSDGANEALDVTNPS